MLHPQYRTSRFFHLSSRQMTLIAGLSVVAAFVTYFLIYPGSSILHGHCDDPDDYLYLALSLDWLKGQHWYDLIMYRENPPDGTYIHYSRLLSSLYGVVIFAVSNLTHLDLYEAGMVTALIMPIVFFILLLPALRLAASSFVSETYIWFAFCLALYGSAISRDFLPGHVDHHGLELVVAIAAFGCMTRMLQQPEILRWAFFSALALTFGMVIGVEFLPFFMLGTGFAGLWSMMKGGVASRAGVVFGCSLMSTGIVFLLGTKPVTGLFQDGVMSYSAVYVALACGIASCYICTFLADQKFHKPVARYIAAVVSMMIASGLFLYLFPELRNGPIGDLNPRVAEFTYRYIGEAMPVVNLRDVSSLGIFLILGKFIIFLWPIMAFPASLFFIWRSKGTARWAWGITAIYLATASCVAAFYQVRFMGYAELFCIIPLACILEKGWAKVKTFYRERRIYAFGASLLLLCFFIVLVFVPDHDNWQLGNGLYEEADTCDIQSLAWYLNQPEYNSRPQLIMTTPDIGAELLFRTNHQVLAVSDFFDVSGLVDFMDFFDASHADDAAQIAQKRNIDLVVLCESGNQYNAPVTQNGHFVYLNGVRQLSFGERLTKGEIPAWLKPVRSPVLSDLAKVLLFQVDRKALKHLPR